VQPSLPDPRRGAVAVIERESRLLVIRRSASVVAPGAFCFPGGGIEAGETEEQALVREFHEELGAAIRPLRRVWSSTTRWHVQLAWWLGEVELGAMLSPNPAEVESSHWMTREEMLDGQHLLESNRAFLRALSRGEVVLD
jgi:8-oxo-dGTP diphosphatase